MQRRTLLIGGGAVAAAGALVGGSFVAMGSPTHYAAAMADVRAPLKSGDDVREMVRYAVLAANGHNTQPWRFHASGQSVAIRPDFARRTPIVDPDDHHVFVSLGCAAENLAQAGAALGKPGEVRFADGGLVYDYLTAAPAPSPLCEAIRTRRSSRAPFDGNPVPVDDLIRLEQASEQAGVNAVMITNRNTIEQVRDMLIAANSVQMADAKFVAELKRWMRFNPGAALESGDGLYSASSGNPTCPA
jgi:hypothetical protein